MNIFDWARKHNIPAAALRELVDMTVYTPRIDPEQRTGSEDFVTSQCRLTWSHNGIKAFRNNVGASNLADGSFVRWGLANESKAMNERIKSADWVGIKSRLIVETDVGKVIGQFWSREIKHSKWHYTGTADQVAQLNWANFVNAAGGDAKVIAAPESSDTL